MKILKARSVEYVRYANPARIEILVDKIPDYRGMIYDSRELDGYTLYFAEQDGYVSFYAHNPKNETGYGGDKFELTLRSGEIRVVKGPWSSRPDVMNAAGFTKSIDASITDDPAVFDKGYTFMSGNITTKLLSDYLIAGGDMPYVEKE